MAFEIAEVQSGGGAGGTAPSLNAPVCRQPGTTAQLEEYRGSDKQRLAGELVQADSLIFPEVSSLAPKKKTRTDLSHDGQRGTDGGLPLGLSGCRHARPFRLINQVKRRDTEVGDQFAV